MPTFELTGKDGGTYQVDAADEHAAVAAFSTFEGGGAAPAAPDVGDNRASLLAALRGVPIAGAYADKAAAALNAAAQPLTETGLSHAPTFADRMAENEQQLKAGTDVYEKANPIGTTVGKVAMGTLAMVPAMAAAPEAFGLTGATMAGRALAGATSNAAIGGVDATVRGENIPQAMAVNGALGFATPFAGKVAGKVVDRVLNRGAAPAEAAIPAGSEIKDAAKEGYDAVRASGVTVKPESVQKLASEMHSEFVDDGFRSYLAPKTFSALDELKNGDAFTTAAGRGMGDDHAATVAQLRSKYGDAAANAYDAQMQARPTVENQSAAGVGAEVIPNKSAADYANPMQTAAPKAQSLLEFIASKGGLGPDAELAAIGGEGHTVNVEGVGRRKLVRQGGWPLDYAREAAEEAGYLRGNHNETSTINDLLDAMDAEMRGQKRYPEGHEGTVTKRESVGRSEREQHELERHMQGFESDLAAAGHGELGPEVKDRAVKLMANEGVPADTAVERALLQLEQEDNAVSYGAGFPGDRPAVAAPAATVAAAKAAPSRVVSFSDLHGLRRVLGKAAQSPDGVERAAASRALTRLDRYLENIPAADVIGGDANKAAAMLKEANANYTVAKLAERLQGKVDAAHLQASSANSGANIENALRQRIKDILKSEKLRRGFTSRELIELQKIVRGTASANVIRALGNMLGGGGGLGTIISGGAGALAGGPVGAVVAPAAGFALKKVGGKMTEAQLARLDEMIRARAPASEAARAVRAARDAAAAARQAKLQRAASLGVGAAAIALPDSRR